MVKKLLNRIIRRRHFWRDAGFDELTELYISSMLRTFAVSILMVFIPYYLYQLGYPVYQIFIFFAFYFSGRWITDIGAAYFVARFGPKHSMVVGCVLQIIVSAMMLCQGQYHWQFWLLGTLFGASASFFFIAYHVEFSKVKHAVHSGKEIGNMQIFQKLAAIAGPLVGGGAGTLLGPQYIFVIASVVLVLSLWPLFRSAEPVRIRQKIDFRAMPYRRMAWDYVSYAGLGIENTLCVNLWPLYISLFALTGSVYAKLGALSSFSVIASIAAAHMIGKYIDTNTARPLLRISSIANALVYIVRPFVGSLWPAFATNIVNEVVTTGYRLPYLKGFYARPDEFPSHTIVYVASMEAFGSVTKAVAWWLLAIIAISIDARVVISIGFALAALSSLLITSERFPAISKRKSYNETQI